MGYLLVNSRERMAIDAEGDIKEEENEIQLLSQLFPAHFPDLDPTNHDVVLNPVPPILSELLDNSGLAPAFDAVDKFLPDKIPNLLDSEILLETVIFSGDIIY